MAEMADEIAALAAAVAAQRATSQPETRGAPDLTPVDIGKLPDTPYRRLVGREDLLKRLDDAWAKPGEAILSLIAEGGAGKSALVNAWLLQLQTDGYRSANRVLGWSFMAKVRSGACRPPTSSSIGRLRNLASPRPRRAP